MKKSIKSLSLLSILAVMPTHALFSNGGFEDTQEGLANWNVRYGYATGSGTSGSATVDWNTVYPGQPEAQIVVPTSDPNNTNPLNFYDPFVPEFNTPYEGTHKALLNFHLHSGNWAPGGYFHVTQISQKGTVTTNDVVNGKLNLFVSWGAVMNDPQHGSGQDPFFEISIKVNGQDVPGGYELHYSSDPSSNWQLVDNSPTSDAIYYTSRVFSYAGLKVGDEVELVLTVADCSQGGHGVYAWIDYAGTADPCDMPNPPPYCIDNPSTSSCVSARDQFRMADNSVITGNVISGGYGEMGAYSKIGGDLQVKGVSFLRSSSEIAKNFTHESSESFQEGATILGTNTQAAVTAPVIASRVLTPGTGWYEIQNGAVQTLTAGPYGDVVIRDRAVVTLEPGTYTFNSLDVEGGATLIFNNAASPIVVQVAGNLDIRSNAKLQIPEAKNLEWYTHDSRMEVHSNVALAGSIIAPVGQIVMQSQGTLLGSIAALDVLVESRSVVTCSDNAISSSSSSTPSSSSSAGSFVCSGDCLNAQVATWGGNLNTTAEVWFVTTGPINGWQASEVQDRVIEVNGLVVNNGQVPLVAAADGKYYFHFGAGSKAWASWSKW